MQGGKKWNEVELAFLKENWGILTSTQLVLKLNRNIQSISTKASKLGLVVKKDKSKSASSIPLEKMKGLTLHNSPGVKNKERVFETKKCSISGKTPYRVDIKTVVYIPDTMTNEEAREVLKMYRGLKLPTSINNIPPITK
jgi:hypothetical protein